MVAKLKSSISLIQASRFVELVDGTWPEEPKVNLFVMDSVSPSDALSFAEALSFAATVSKAMVGIKDPLSFELTTFPEIVKHAEQYGVELTTHDSRHKPIVIA